MKASTRTLILASGNAGKRREIEQILSDLPLRIVPLTDFPPIDEPVEDGEHFRDNARIKALHYARATGQWCLADDSGLEVDALGGAPGVYSARYALGNSSPPPGADRKAIDAANNARLLRELAGVDAADRGGRFVCHLAAADPTRVLLEARGCVEGVILDRPRGENGFGYDPLFFLPELGMTAAELTADEKNRISHRGKAVRSFAQQLRSFLAASATR